MDKRNDRHPISGYYRYKEAKPLSITGRQQYYLRSSAVERDLDKFFEDKR